MESRLDVFVRGYEHLTPDERHRLRRADAVYDAVFEEAGLRTDFYQKPEAWLEYVEGMIDEWELWEKLLADKEHALRCLCKAA